ncbi:PGF-CTERM sorting domain-containing protein, partial [Halomicrobium sp. IBSBa]|nr:PGF-CTERM sorting domain-containing protein [Halomicrobium sp. IBSBa]
AIYTTSERDATLDLDDSGVVTVSAAAGQEVTGETNVAPGSELEVEMESESDANPFVIRPEIDVATDGTYTATADFSDYSAGTNFTVQTLDVDGDSDFSDEEDGRIIEADTATVSISDQESDGSEVVVDSAQ